MTRPQFAPEREEQFSSLKKAKTLLDTKYKLEGIELDLSSLNLTPEYHLVHDGENYQMTNRAFRGLLSRLNIPPRFALSIPEDLLEVIVRRLREVKPQRITLHQQEGTIYGLTREEYESPDLGSIMEVLGTEREVAMGRVGTDGVRVATVGTSKAEPKVGDIIRMGMHLTASNSGRPYPRASLMTYRLVCKNGAVTGTAWGEVSWPREDEAFEIFTNGLRDLMGHEERLAVSIKRLSERPLKDIEFARIWKLTRKVVGVEAADRMLGVDKDERRTAVLTAVTNRRAHEAPADMKDLLAYDVFNEVSAAARKLPGESAERLMRAAGTLLSLPA